MRWIPNKLRMWGLLLVSFAVFVQYLQHRERIFQVPETEFNLSAVPSKDQIQKLAYPLLDLNSPDFTYTSDTFVDRSSVKFLQQTLSKEEFKSVLANENIPLWGWEIKISKPIHATLMISHKHELIGFKLQDAPKLFRPLSDTSKAWTILQSKTGKDLSKYQNNIPQNAQEVKFRREIPDTQMLEAISVRFDRGTIQSFNSTLLLPATYAYGVNQTIEKQKTLHQVFNLFHYLLIGLIFLFLFRAYENKNLSWKKNSYVFLVLFVTQLIAFLFQRDEANSTVLSLFQALIRTIGHTTWMFALIVAADFMARVYPKSTYSLSDIFTRSFFASHYFRRSLIYGWILFVAQLTVVGIFYMLFQKYSAYVPLKIPGEHSLHSSFEFLKYFSDSLSTAIYEEVLYRLFLICFFAFIVRKAWPAVIFSSVMWGFLHFSYQFEPYYIRGLELTLVGLLYGFAMLRYGILSVIFAHFFYNSFIISEYENQANLYMTVVITLAGLAVFISHVYHKRHPSFVFERAEFPHTTGQTPPVQQDRRNILRRIYPLNWKYGLASLLMLIFILTKVPFGGQPAQLINNQKLIQTSDKIAKSYEGDGFWSLAYHEQNYEIQGLYSEVKKSEHRKELVQKLEPYSYLWSVRYFGKPDSKIICDLDYSQNYELLRMDCPVRSASKLSFDEWVRLVKDPEETWTLFNVDKASETSVQYEYNVASDDPLHLTKKVFLNFNNGQLVLMHKRIGVNFIDPVSKQDANSKLNYVSIFLSIIVVGIFIGFLRFFFISGNSLNFHDKKSWMAVGISCFMYALWKLNSYKVAMIEYDQMLTLKHFIFNEILVSSIKLMAIAAVTYVLFYGFFHFPSMVFKHAPTSNEWNGILSRPIWKWRNTKVSLLYAALLLCIQTLLRVLVQINNGIPSLDLFHFDISYLNHEYMFVTFISLVWKNVLFWCALLIVITIFEKYFPRWAYLLILSTVVLVNILMSSDGLDSKLIEICGIYIVFYFIYNVARFDFAFYFWFVVLNTLVSFVPLLIYPQFASYFYQVIFIFIFVLTMVLYTLVRTHKIQIQQVNPS